MTLFTHTIVGTTAASFVTGNPVLGFGLALGSHYVSDMIPHWEYKLRTKSLDPDFEEKITWTDKNLWVDIAKLTVDFGLGIIVSILLFKLYFGVDWLTIIVGIIGGVLPDILQFSYAKIKKEPFLFLQKIHNFFHTETKWSKEPVKGISIQIVTIALFIYLFYFDK
jgi:hypothetical protein